MSTHPKAASAIKGAMSEPDFEAARLTVRLPAIIANYRTYRRMAGPTAVAAVVKADGYGLGAAQIGSALAGAGCDTFFVARLKKALRCAGLCRAPASWCWMAPSPMRCRRCSVIT